MPGSLFTETRSVAANGRWNIIPSLSIYGESGHDFNGTVAPDGPVDGVVQTMAASDETFDIYESNIPAQLLHFPIMIDSHRGWTNEVSILNQNPDLVADITLELYDTIGIAVDAKSITLPPYVKYNFQPRRFGNGSLIIRASQPVCAMNMYENGKALSIYEGISSE